MHADPRTALSGRPEAMPPDHSERRFFARRAVGALSTLFLLFALTTTGAWAEGDVTQPTTTEPTPTESPSETPTPEPTEPATPSPSPTPTPTPSTPTPSPAPDNEDEGSEDEDDTSDEDEDPAEDSDGDEAEEPNSDSPEPTEPGDPTTEAPTPPTTGAPVSFDEAGNLTLETLVVSVLADPAAVGDPIDASFTASPTSGTAPLEVEFDNTSECYASNESCQYGISYRWDFGDRTFSTEANPGPHEYSRPGKYTVTLTVGLFCYGESDYCEFEDEASRIITVTGPQASFTAVPSSGPAPLTVKFTDTSTGDIDSRSWAFAGSACGAASAGPDENQFIEVFTTPGTCIVTLTIQFATIDRRVGQVHAAATDSASKTITVKPPLVPQDEDDDSDDSGDSDDSDDSGDSDDNGDPVPGVFLPNQPPLSGQPTPEPTDPSPSPTAPVKPAKPTPPTPTEPLDTRPASWITGEGASGAGIALMILAAVIGSLRGLSMASRRVALVADRDENTVQRHVAARDAEGWGDRSFTWRFPGHRLIDAASVVVPDRLFRFSPLVGRVAEDGSEFRAMFGSLWLATPLAGIALGLASAAAAGGRAMPPSVWLVVAGAVLATFDAFSGAVAVALFAGAALVGGLGGVEGGPDVVHSLLVILTIGFLWMAIPLIGSAIRPFRRLGDGSLRHRWDVIGDGLIAALLCGWVAQKLTQAMDLFAGQKTGLPEHANTIAFVVMAAVALRVTMEHFAMSAYPQRLQQVEGADPPQPLLFSVVLGAFIRTAVFGFIGYAFIGSCWQLWLGIGLFLIPQLIDHLRERFRNIGFVQRILPRGIVEIFILVVACTLAARFAMDQSGDSLSGIRMAFLLIAIPPALLGALRVFAEDPDESGDTTWPREFLGALIVVVTAVLASRGWDY